MDEVYKLDASPSAAPGAAAGVCTDELVCYAVLVLRGWTSLMNLRKRKAGRKHGDEDESEIRRGERKWHKNPPTRHKLYTDITKLVQQKVFQTQLIL